MATMVNRKVWWIGCASIESGIVTHQNFDPDFLMVKPEGPRFEETKSPNRVFLTPQEAIKEAREYAGLLLNSASVLEGTLEDAAPSGNNSKHPFCRMSNQTLSILMR